MNSNVSKPLQGSPLTTLSTGIQPQGGVTLQLIGSKIERAAPKQLISWLKRHDREYGTLYADEAKLLEDTLNQICMGTVNHQFGFLQASEFIRALRTKANFLGPPTDTDPSKVMFGIDKKTSADMSGALKAGYRMFNTAQAYQNLDLLYLAIQRSGLPRESLILVYKFDALASKELTLEHLEQTVKPFGYFDSIIIHNANESEQAILASWEGLKTFKVKNGCKKIGIGNFKSEQSALLNKIKPVDIVELEAFELIISADMGNLLQTIGRPEVLYYQLIQMMQSANIGLSRGKLTAITNLICDSTAGIYIDQEPIPILSSSSQQNRVDNLSVLNPASVEDADCLTDMHHYTLAGRNCTENAPEIQLSSAQREALLGFINRNNEYRENWKNQNLETKVSEIFPSLTPILTTLSVPTRIGLKRVYVGRNLLTIIRTTLGQSCCDRKWSIELAQLLLMDCETWTQNKAMLVNIT